ncbi:hypothetical protein Tco_1236108 [Tanacetum coccineum]
MSSYVAEYIAADEDRWEVSGLRKFIDGLGDVMPSNKRHMEMLCDNAPAIAVTNDPDEEIILVSVHDVHVVAGEEVFVAEQDVVEEVVEVINTAKLIIDAAQVSAAGDIVSTASATTTVSAATTTPATIKTVDDITLAQPLKEMKSTNPKKKGVVIQDLGESTTTISSQLSSQQLQEKGKGILIEPVKPMNKKNQIRNDEETALNLQAKFDEEERLAREKAGKKNPILP